MFKFLNPNNKSFLKAFVHENAKNIQLLCERYPGPGAKAREGRGGWDGDKVGSEDGAQARPGEDLPHLHLPRELHHPQLFPRGWPQTSPSPGPVVKPLTLPLIQ